MGWISEAKIGATQFKGGKKNLMKVAEKNARVPSLLLLEQRSEARHIHLVEPTAASRLAVLKNKGVEGPG